MSEDDNNCPAIRNQTWSYSEPALRAIHISLQRRVIGEHEHRDLDSVRHNLETQYSDESSPRVELHPNVVIKREFIFSEIDTSLTENNEHGIRTAPNTR